MDFAAGGTWGVAPVGEAIFPSAIPIAFEALTEVLSLGASSRAVCLRVANGLTSTQTLLLYLVGCPDCRHDGLECALQAPSSECVLLLFLMSCGRFSGRPETPDKQQQKNCSQRQPRNDTEAIHERQETHLMLQLLE
jgi:hypothetical protein